MTAPRISVLIPVSDRYDSQDALLDEIYTALELEGSSFEIVYVFDGHRGREAANLREAVAGREGVRVVELRQQLGEPAVLATALAEARGEFILRVPPYRQVEFEMLPALIRYLESGVECVLIEREDENARPTGGLQRRWLNRALSRLAHVEVRDIGCQVCGFTHELARSVPVHGDLHRFLPIVVAREGFATTHLRARARRSAESPPRSPRSYLARTLDLLAVLFLARSTGSPLRFFGLLGAAPLAFGSLILLWLGAERVFQHQPLAGRPLLLLGLLLIAAGMQALAIGFLGELMVYLHYRDRHPDRVTEMATSERGRTVPSDDEPRG